MSDEIVNENSFPELRVVEASAGSGKTYTLAKRFIQLSLNPQLRQNGESIRHILAITFTNKAAVEMKERILDFLKRIALKQLSSAEFADMVSPLHLNSEQASRVAHETLKEVMLSFHVLQVQTIDKFINALMTGCAYPMGLSSGFQISSETDRYLMEGLDQLIDMASDDAEIMMTFKNFLHQYLFVENKMGWFPKAGVFKIVRFLFQRQNIFGRRFWHSGVSGAEVVKRKSHILSLMRELKPLLPEKTNKQFLKSFDKFLDQHDRGFDVDDIPKKFCVDEPPLNKGAEADAKLFDVWHHIHIQLCDLIQEEASSVFNPYLNIIDLVNERMAEFSQRDNVVFLDELNKKTSQLFEYDSITIQEIFYRMANRFRHYLLDEFQDTSRLQWLNLRSLISEALSTGGSLFMVGDRKQAIYSFRGGDETLFDHVPEEFSTSPTRRMYLETNWRSDQAVIDFNNQVFSLENLTRFIKDKERYELEKKRRFIVPFSKDDFERLKHIYGHAYQQKKSQTQSGFVYYKKIDDLNRQEREDTIRYELIEKIQQSAQAYAYSDMVILARNNAEIEKMTSWLMSEGIPVQSERTSSILHQQQIHEILIFFKFLAQPTDNLLFTECLMSSIFLQATQISWSEMETFLIKLRQSAKQKKATIHYYKAFMNQWPQLWDQFFKPFINYVGITPVYQLLIRLYARWQILKNNPETQGFFMHLLEIFQDLESEHHDLDSFLEAFSNLIPEKLYVHVSGQDAVKLLTIHKSKGLEFTVVFIPFLAMDIQVGAGAERAQTFSLQHLDEGMALFRLKQSYYPYSDHLLHMYYDEYIRSFFAELNNIYVALTRSRSELYLWIPAKQGLKINPVQFLFNENQQTFGQPKSTQKAKIEMTTEIFDLIQHQDISYKLQDEYLALDTVHQRAENVKGNHIHWLLSQVENLSMVDQPESYLKNIWLRARNRYPDLESSTNWPEFNDFIHDQAMRPVFYAVAAKVVNEMEMIDEFGRTLRMDRVIFGESITIIDFKTSAMQVEEQIAQVKTYCDLMRGIYPNKPIQGHLVYWQKRQIVEVS